MTLSSVRTTNGGRSILKSLESLSNVGIPRCYRPLHFDPVEAEIHCFCDAYQVGYGVELLYSSDLYLLGPKAKCTAVLF